MRTIKFRAWDLRSRRKNKWIKNFNVTYDGRVESMVDTTTLGGSDPHTYDKVELMQYTGLKDKNGKEIYEGDVLQAYNFLGEKLEKYQVVWELNGFHYKKDLKSDSSVYLHKDLVEVVGNVYENSELI